MGGAVLALGLVNGQAMAVSAGSVGSVGGASGVMADSALAVFLLGLAVGVPAGIAMFFAYLVMREKRETEQDRQMEDLMASLEETEARDSPWNGSASRRDFRQTTDVETAEDPKDPWERPADWWRHAGDDA